MSAQDDRLVEELRGVAARRDSPPADVVAAAHAALTWRTVDAELAELAYDSFADDRALAGVRGATDTPRLVTFQAGGVTVEVEVAVQDHERQLMGQVVPMQPAEVEIRHRDGVTIVETDDLGRFRADALPAGPVSLRCRVQVEATTRVVHTDWVAI